MFFDVWFVFWYYKGMWDVDVGCVWDFEEFLGSSVGVRLGCMWGWGGDVMRGSLWEVVLLEDCLG